MSDKACVTIRLGASGILVKADVIQELRADDAAIAPDLSDRGHRQRPVEFARSFRHHGKALRIGADRGGEKRQFKVLFKCGP